MIALYPASWLAVTLYSAICFPVVLWFSAFFRYRITPELTALSDVYFEDIDLENTENIVHGKILFGEKFNFFSVQVRPEGLVFLHSRNFCKLLIWDRMWQIKETDDDSRFVEVTFVSDTMYTGPKRLVIPWKEDFWSLVPEAKKGR